jgi:hypothetical protein
MRALPALLVLAATACAPAATSSSATSSSATTPPAATPTAVSLAGGYALRQVSGHDLPTSSPTEPNVELTRGWLQLGANGAFALTLAGRRNQEPTPGEVTMRGTYTVTANVLQVTANGQPGPSFHFTLDGRTLTLVDDKGGTYTMERQLEV